MRVGEAVRQIWYTDEGMLRAVRQIQYICEGKGKGRGGPFDL